MGDILTHCDMLINQQEEGSEFGNFKVHAQNQLNELRQHQLDNHALQHDLAEHAVVRGLTADLNELKTFIRDTLCTDFAALQHSSVGLAHDLNDVNEALQAVNLESDATRGRLDDAQNLLADRVRATVREIHHFALHRRVFIPLFYGVSEVFLRPPKIPL